MTPDKLREKGNRWRELGQYDLANISNQHAAALEEIERLKVLVAEAPWQRAGVDDWRCRECLATVFRGIYPTAFGHAAHCSHSIRDVVDRAEKAERRAERLEAEHYEALLIQKKKMQEVIDYWQGIAESRADKGE